MSCSAELFSGDSLNPEWLPIHTKDEDPTEPHEHLLSSEASVPPFWLALFDPQDISEAPHFEDDEPFPFLVVPRGNALRRATERQGRVEELFPEAAAHYGHWLHRLQSSGGSHFSVDLCEIESLSGPLKEDLQAALAVFDDPSAASLAALASLMDLSVDGGRITVTGQERPPRECLMGYSRDDS